MNLRKHFAGLFCAGVFLLGCHANRSGQIPVYNLSTITEETELKLTDLVKNIRIVPLETSADIMLQERMNGGYRMVVTSEYIMMLCVDAIYQFDAFTGKYIRCLASFGRGPQEYGNILAATIDYKNEILYLAHNGSTNKLAINYKTGAFLPVVPVSDGTLCDLECVLPDGRICLPDDTLMFCGLHPVSGKVTSLLSATNRQRVKESSRTDFIKYFGKYSVSLNQDEIYLFHQKYSDTLYQYKAPDDCKKILAVCSDNIQKEREGSAIRFNYIDDEAAICLTYAVKLIETNGNYALLNSAEKAYKINRKNQQIQHITKFIFNPLFIIEAEGDSAIAKAIIHYNNHKYYAKALNSYLVKEAIEMTLKDPTLAKDKIIALKELNSQLTEPSNPVVIIGEKR